MGIVVLEAQVRDAQQALGALGYYDGPIDGLLNSASLTDAITRFQHDHMRKGLFKGWIAKGLLSDGTYAKIIETFSKQDSSYNAPAFYPVRPGEMRDAREGLLRAEEMLEGD